VPIVETSSWLASTAQSVGEARSVPQVAIHFLEVTSVNMNSTPTVLSLGEIEDGSWQRQAATETPFKDKRKSMATTLKLTHKAIGVEVRRGTYDIVVDGQRAGSLEMNDTIELPVQPGLHTLQVRNGRNSSRTQTFDAIENQTVAFRCTGKSFLPIFLASFVIPSLALQLRRTVDDQL
jgi:hypothetical protein